MVFQYGLEQDLIQLILIGMEVIMNKWLRYMIFYYSLEKDLIQSIIIGLEVILDK